ncbi:MAG: DNA polymerase III subunit gamma/tau [Thermodesulfobacteriota bacterium]|nr:DNA polymerase III subunit gamma/tau [Thermodesulfobacteriota bacterium]
MSYEVFARKWRPQVFQDVIGQDHITQTLMNAIKSDRLAHAYLLSGARGVGKTSVARILAKAVNCEEGEPGIPCNICRSCKEITDGSSVDVQEIDGASNRGIGEIRELRENIRYMPSSSRFRIYIIDEVHMLTTEAFNALLKTLEEPPPHVKFFFATTEPHKVPVTILSRCQRFDFKRIPLIKIIEQLEKITGEEAIEISKSGLALIAREAEGSMRDAEGLIDQVVSYTGPKVEDKDITDILGIIDRDLIFETSLAIIEGNPDKCIGIVDRIYNYGYDIREFYRALMDQFRNLIVSLIAPQNDLLDMTDNDKEEIRRQAGMAGQERLQQSLNLFIAREENLRYTSHPRLVLETILIQLCRLGDVLSFDELIKKIEALEKRISPSAIFDDNIPAGHVSDPGIDWKKKEEKKKGPKIDDDQDQRHAWDRFMNFLSSKNMAMSNVLKGWSLLNLSADTIELIRGANSFSSAYLDEPERLENLAGYCRDFFKRDIKIKIKDNKKNNSEKANPTEENKSNAGGKSFSDLPPPVQDILHFFQGEIKEEVL